MRVGSSSITKLHKAGLVLGDPKIGLVGTDDFADDNRDVAAEEMICSRCVVGGCSGAVMACVS